MTNRIPIENRAIDTARQTASAGYQNTADILSKYGLANSGFGARLLAEEGGQLSQQVADVPANVTEQILGQAPSVALGAGSLGGGELGTAAGIDINRTQNASQTGYGFDWQTGQGGTLGDIGSLLAFA